MREKYAYVKFYGGYMEELIVNDEQSLRELFKRVRKAQSEFATYTQEQVDKIFLAAATAADKARIDLAIMAVEETGMGIVEDKVIKNHYAAEYIYNAYRDVKTCDVISRDDAYGVETLAEPVGVPGGGGGPPHPPAPPPF